MTINIEWQDKFGRWQHYQSKQNQSDAYRVAQRRAESTGKRYRLGKVWATSIRQIAIKAAA